MLRRCLQCKRALPWTTEYFRPGRGGLQRRCQRCCDVRRRVAKVVLSEASEQDCAAIALELGTSKAYAEQLLALAIRKLRIRYALFVNPTGFMQWLRSP